MARKCFISCKTEDFAYKNSIRKLPNLDMIDKSLYDVIDSNNEDYIMQVIRRDYLSDSTVTIHLIGPYSNENLGWNEQKYIKRELQASLYHGVGNTQNGILGIVLPPMYDFIYGGSYQCATCGNSHSTIRLNNSTSISEFWYNYYIPNGKCGHPDDDRYCILVKWDDFIVNPEFYIETAYTKRSHPIAHKTKTRP